MINVCTNVNRIALANASKMRHIACLPMLGKSYFVTNFYIVDDVPVPSKSNANFYECHFFASLQIPKSEVDIKKKILYCIYLMQANCCPRRSVDVITITVFDFRATML